MKSLKNIKLIPRELLLEMTNTDNPISLKLQKLLVMDENILDLSSVTDFSPLSENELLSSEYVSFVPITDTNITNISRNSFVIINLDEIDFSNWENNTRVSGSFFIGVSKDRAIINHKDSRLLEIVDCLLQLFDGYKLSSAGKISMEYASFIVYSEQTFGYKIVFRLSDQTDVRKAEI